MSLGTPCLSFPAPGKATLKRWVQGQTPESFELLGYVIAAPNVPREYHSGYDPVSNQRSNQIGTDFLDRVIYVKGENLNAAQAVINGCMVLGRGMDSVDSTGCAGGSMNTGILELVFDQQGNTSLQPLGYFHTICALFDSTEQYPMQVSEYWISDSLDLFDTQQFKDAYALHLQMYKKNKAIDDKLRQKVMDHVTALSNAKAKLVLTATAGA